MARLRWTLLERDNVVEDAAKILGPDGIFKKSVLFDSQSRIEPARRKKSIQGPLLNTLKKLIAKQQQQMRSSAPAPVVEDPSPQEQPVVEPQVPNRLGLDPKFADSLVYVAQSFARCMSDAMVAAAREMGREVGRVTSDSMRELVRDARLGMLFTGQHGPAPAPAEPEEPPRGNATGDLPERFRKPKLLILGLAPDPQQAQALVRRLPNADLRFIDRELPSGKVAEMAKKCDATFYGRFTRHAQTKEARTHSAKWIQINGNASDFARQIAIHFPQALPQNTGEHRAAEAAVAH